MVSIKVLCLLTAILFSISCSTQFQSTEGNHEFSGNWRGNGEDSEGNKFSFEAKVIKVGVNEYKILITDKIDSNNEPFHVISGALKNNIFVSTADGHKYRGGGKLSSKFYEGFYNGEVNGTYKMWRIR